MSSSRHRSRRPKPKGNKLNKSHNIQLYKLIDPIVQSVLFIVFLYCLDAQSHLSYRLIMLIALGWQMLSCVVNYLINDTHQLKIQRTGFLILAVIYLFVYYYIQHNVPETMIAPDKGFKATIPLKQVILMTVAMVLAFWYNVICYQEIRKILGGVINRGRGK